MGDSVSLRLPCNDSVFFRSLQLCFEWDSSVKVGICPTLNWFDVETVQLLILAVEFTSCWCLEHGFCSFVVWKTSVFIIIWYEFWVFGGEVWDGCLVFLDDSMFLKMGCWWICERLPPFGSFCLVFVVIIVVWKFLVGDWGVEIWVLFRNASHFRCAFQLFMCVFDFWLSIQEMKKWVEAYGYVTFIEELPFFLAEVWVFFF